jgi:aminoglycoside phosphotransferase (APT) family kinase protein
MKKSFINNIHIDVTLVQRLIIMQFPEWVDLPIQPVKSSGWDNRTFHLGEHMMVRLPSSAHYAEQVIKEQHWLPKLASQLPLPISTPLAMGKPCREYPWHWSIYKWIDGDTVTIERIQNLDQFAIALAEFLKALQRCDTTKGPLPGTHNFYRGGNLAIYAVETQQAIKILDNKIDTTAAIDVWNTAISSTWQHQPVWVHGDIALGNLLIKNGHLSAVIDFGTLCIGDPSCDLAIAWTLFKGESREAFYKTLDLDKYTWQRARGWVLWKALIIAADLVGTNAVEGKQCWHIIDEVLEDHSNNKNLNI